MKRSVETLAGALGALLLLARSAHAEDVPAHFVEADQCTSRPCSCADAPIMEQFLQNQKDARAAFQLVHDQLPTPQGAQSNAQAVSQFQGLFGAGNAHVNAQFMSCAGYDPAVNKLTKVAGISGLGTAKLDPCFCDAFCKDIVDSTIAHERMHAPTLLLGFHDRITWQTACKLGVLPDRVCNMLDPLNLVESELISHQVGINSLESSLNALKASDPAMPGMMCTWTPLASAGSAAPPAQRAPTPPSFFARVELLIERIVWGAEPV
jgi:hypothetical protein